MGEESNEELVKLLKLCVDGKKGVVDAEFKVAVVSFHQTPSVICPYFVALKFYQV